jgi:hypothetical protein
MAIIHRLTPIISSLFATAACAQIWGPRHLEDLKAETQRRRAGNLPPIAGIKPPDAPRRRRTLERLATRGPGQRMNREWRTVYEESASAGKDFRGSRQRLPPSLA